MYGTVVPEVSCVKVHLVGFTTLYRCCRSMGPLPTSMVQPFLSYDNKLFLETIQCKVTHSSLSEVNTLKHCQLVCRGFNKV